jgi:hypothetical protein
MQINSKTTMQHVVDTADLIETETDYTHTDEILDASPVGIDCYVLNNFGKLLVPKHNIVRIHSPKELEVDAFCFGEPGEKRILRFRAFTSFVFVE